MLTQSQRDITRSTASSQQLQPLIDMLADEQAKLVTNSNSSSCQVCYYWITFYKVPKCNDYVYYIPKRATIICFMKMCNHHIHVNENFAKI